MTFKIKCPLYAVHCFGALPHYKGILSKDLLQNESILNDSNFGAPRRVNSAFLKPCPLDIWVAAPRLQPIGFFFPRQNFKHEFFRTLRPFARPQVQNLWMKMTERNRLFYFTKIHVQLTKRAIIATLLVKTPQIEIQGTIGSSYEYRATLSRQRTNYVFFN